MSWPDDRCCDEDFGGSHYHCAYCRGVSGMQGHPECVAKANADRRAIPRTLCQVGDCNLYADHVGKHRGSCGCINGCKAKDCPNL